MPLRKRCTRRVRDVTSCMQLTRSGGSPTFRSQRPDDLRPGRLRYDAPRMGVTRRSSPRRLHLLHTRGGLNEVDVLVALDETRCIRGHTDLRHLGVGEQREEGFSGECVFLRMVVIAAP